MAVANAQTQMFIADEAIYHYKYIVMRSRIDLLGQYLG